MRMSCNGCRVLRKGCSEDCIIRPCLDWIKNPDSQANATVLLAKFYGRAGLLNLLTAVPLHQRPCLFRSLLYESCGRMVNPIYGSVGLLWSGKWHLCQAAVDAVLRGTPIVPAASSLQLAGPSKCFDIRHVAKRSAKSTLHKVAVNSTNAQFKRSGKKNVTPIDHQSWQQLQLVHKTMLSFESPTTVVDNDNLELTLGTSPSKTERHDGDDVDTCRVDVSFSFSSENI